MKHASSGHGTAVLLEPQTHVLPDLAEAERSEPAPAQRITSCIRAHYRFIWRSIRRMGLEASDADDASQKVMEVFARRCGEITPGKEKSFMFQAALRVCADFRKAKKRSRTDCNEETLATAVSDVEGPEEQLRRAQARAQLDEVLEALDADIRAVFVLFELEELSTTEIADLLQIPPGTVSSRLRRAREAFEVAVARRRAGKTS